MVKKTKTRTEEKNENRDWHKEKGESCKGFKKDSSNSFSFKESQLTNHLQSSLSIRILLSTNASSRRLGSGRCTKNSMNLPFIKLPRLIPFEHLDTREAQEIIKHQKKMENNLR